MTARKCAGCGRALRKSLGPFGPTCARKLAQSPSGGRTAPRGPRVPPKHPQALRRPPVTPQPGQDELPLEET